MYCFLLPLLLGFACNAFSAFTTAFSRQLGDRAGRAVTFILRNLLGIPLWVIGLSLAVRAPAPLIFPPTALTEFIGWLLVAAGLMPICAALLVIGWRAVAPSLRDQLEARGPYRYIRHPIYTGLLFEFAGILLLQPTLSILVASAFSVAWAYLQARLEEHDLLQRMPAYRQYMLTTPRFLPRLR